MTTADLSERCCMCDASALSENVREDLIEMGYSFEEAHRISKRVRGSLSVQLIDSGYCDEHERGRM